MVKVKEDLTGRVFSRLTVIRQAEDHCSPKGSKSACWEVQCSCGSAPFTVVSASLKDGATKSCGCLRAERNKEVHSTHNKTKSREYNTWHSMVQRCTNPKNTSFYKYGGIGIPVCERWLNFENFYEDMGERPEGMTLDRIDPFGGYSPENCRWATVEKQNTNKRKSSRNKTGVVGVCWSKSRGKWLATISVNKKTHCLGFFIRFEEACAARKAAEDIYHKDDMRTKEK